MFSFEFVRGLSNSVFPKWNSSSFPHAPNRIFQQPSPSWLNWKYISLAVQAKNFRLGSSFLSRLCLSNTPDWFCFQTIHQTWPFLTSSTIAMPSWANITFYLDFHNRLLTGSWMFTFVLFLEFILNTSAKLTLEREIRPWLQNLAFAPLLTFPSAPSAPNTPRSMLVFFRQSRRNLILGLCTNPSFRWNALAWFWYDKPDLLFSSLCSQVSHWWFLLYFDHLTYYPLLYFLLTSPSPPHPHTSITFSLLCYLQKCAPSCS